LIISGSGNTYGGATSVAAGTLRLGANNALPTGTTLSLGSATTNSSGLFELNGFNQQVAGLSTAGNGAANRIVNGSATAATLTVNSASNSTFGGILGGPNSNENNFGLTKGGSGTLTLTNANTYSGSTIVNGGTLTAGATNAMGGTGPITVNGGGTLALGGTSAVTNRIRDIAPIEMNGSLSAAPATIATNGLSERGGTTSVTPGLGALTLNGNFNILDFGNAAAATNSILAFAGSSGQTWNGILSIYNWTGAPRAGDGIDQLYFGTNTGGLTTTQLDNIRFYSDAGTTFLGTATWAPNLDGEVVPVPEPGTWLVGALALGVVGYTQRRRFSRAARHA
jgi:autotransporter-associated beta strand protein